MATSTSYNCQSTHKALTELVGKRATEELLDHAACTGMSEDIALCDITRWSQEEGLALTERQCEAAFHLVLAYFIIMHEEDERRS